MNVLRRKTSWTHSSSLSQEEVYKLAAAITVDELAIDS